MVKNGSGGALQPIPPTFSLAYHNLDQRQGKTSGFSHLVILTPLLGAPTILLKCSFYPAKLKARLTFWAANCHFMTWTHFAAYPKMF